MIDHLNDEGLLALPDDAPVVMLNLMRFREKSLDGNGSGWDAYLRYSRLTIGLIKAQGGTIIWTGDAEAVAAGIPGAVTLDIGVPLDVAGEVAPDGELQIRELPAGEAGAPPPYGMGLGGVLAHVKALLEKGHGYAWQEVRLPDRAEEAALDDIALDAAPLMVPPKAH